MSYQYRGTTNLIALPNRTVQTYPSGLVRVERSFVCRKADVAKYRREIKVGNKMPSDDGSPALDGIFIFPDPSELVRDDGFVEFRVTAYGRTNTTGQRLALVPSSQLLQFTAFYQAYNINYNPNNPNSPETITRELNKFITLDLVGASYKFCVPANARVGVPLDIREIGGAFLSNTDIDIFSQSFAASEIFVELNGSFTPPTNVRRSPVLITRITSFERSNFGKFDEIIMTVFVGAGGVNFGVFFFTGSVPGAIFIDSVLPLTSGAIVTIIQPQNSNGMKVTIGAETLSAPYSGSAIGETFSISGGTRSGQFLRIDISGLNQNQIYSATIAATNENGVGPTESFSFKTLGSAT